MAKFISDEELNDQIEKAEKHHRWSMKNEPKAIMVKYLPEEKSLLIKLKTGVEINVPLKYIPQLKYIPEHDLNNVDISPLKEMLSWDEYDIDISLKGIILESLNLLTWIEPIIASNKGKVKSENKANAARENGKKGGRPKIVKEEVAL